MEVPDGILLIDKSSGMTSFDVIRELRKKLGVRKMGHAGTLDPLATGLMLIGVGEGTKKLSAYVKLDKEYIAEVLVGERRSTGDMEGEILEEKEVAKISAEKISAILEDMTGTLTLPVSAYSAIKKDGVPMYRRARAAAKEGREVEELPLRDMVVYEAELLKVDNTPIDRSDRALVTVRFHVGSGTYIRSLAEELGKRLAPTPLLPSCIIAFLSTLEDFATFLGFASGAGLLNTWKQRQYRCRGRVYPATLRSLRRTKIGDFDIKDARTLEEI